MIGSLFVFVLLLCFFVVVIGGFCFCFFVFFVVVIGSLCDLFVVVIGSLCLFLCFPALGFQKSFSHIGSVAFLSNYIYGIFDLCNHVL